MRDENSVFDKDNNYHKQKEKERHIPLERKLILRQDPKFRLSIKDRTFFSETTMFITSEVLSDAIKVALTRTIEDLKEQLIELGVEVD